MGKPTKKKKIIHINTTTKATVVFIVFLILVFAIPVKKVAVDVSGLLTAAAIFYSILVGFFFSSAMANLNRLKTLVAEETGALITLYYAALQEFPERTEDVKVAIDRYVIKRFDYEIHNYGPATIKEFFGIFEAFKDVKTNPYDSVALNVLSNTFYYIPQARREITIVGAPVITKISKILLYVLSGIIIISLFLLRNGQVESLIATSMLCSSAILALFILSDVDGNRFGEEEYSIKTYEFVFKAIGLLPYYPTSYIAQGRYKPPEDVYRTGTSDNIETVRKKKHKLLQEIEAKI